MVATTLPLIRDTADRIREREVEIYHDRLIGRPPNPSFRPRLIDLFAGAGGMTLGFTHRMGHDFEVVWANDNDRAACDTYVANFGPHCVHGDIVDILESSAECIPQADVVIGGPPCQGFSLLNRNRADDPRKHLWQPFLQVAERAGAVVFVMENVPQLLGSEEHESIVKMAEAMGFCVASGKLCAADYGVPQTRSRAIILGCKRLDPKGVFPPRRTHYDGSKVRESQLENQRLFVPAPMPWETVRDAIGDLPPPVGTEIGGSEPPMNLHFGRTPTDVSLRRYMAIPEQGMNRFDLQRLVPELTPPCWIRKKRGGTDLFGRMWWDRPSFTVRTEFFKPEKGRYLHPVQHRPMTHREAARLQSFPDDFVFRGKKIQIARQIGNAVPPRLAARIADLVLALMEAQADDGRV